MCFKIRDAIDTAWYVELIARCSSNDDAAADADTTLDAIYVVCGRQVHLFESILDNHTDNSNDNNTSKKIDENNQSNNNNNNNVATMKFARRLLTSRLIRAATLAHDNRLLLVDSRDVVHSFTPKLKPLRKACLRDVCNSSPRIAFCCGGNNDGNLLAFAHNVVALVSLNDSNNNNNDNNIDDDNDEKTDDNIDNHHHQLMVNSNQVLYEKRKQIDLKKKHGGGGGGGVFNSLLGTTRKREKAAQDLLDAKATTAAITRAAPTPHAKSAACASEATRDVLKQTKQKIADNVEKAKHIEQSTAELEQESHNFAQLSKSIADAQKSKSSFFGL